MRKDFVKYFILLGVILIISLSSVYSYSSLLSGLVSYYNFSNNSNDILGKNNLTVTGATYGNGKITSAALFKNLGDKMVRTNGTFPYNITTSGFTICGWFNSSNSTPAYQRVALLGVYGSNSKLGYQIRTDPAAYANGLQFWNNQNSPEKITDRKSVV